MTSHILLVEGDLAPRSTLKNLLELNGWEVDVASDGLEALDLFKQYSFSIVVCDVQLPNLDGLSLLRKLREDGIKTPVVLLTGFADKDLVIRAFRHGAFDIVKKPFQLPDLLEILTRAQEVASTHLRKMLQDLNLSGTQIRILEMVTEGKRNKEIAAVIHISEQGVKYHIASLFRRFSTTCRRDLRSIIQELHTNPIDGPLPLR